VTDSFNVAPGTCQPVLLEFLHIWRLNHAIPRLFMTLK
jgi:hypothetical protein